MNLFTSSYLHTFVSLDITGRFRYPYHASLFKSEVNEPMIFRSPLPDVSIPEMPLAEFIFQHAESRADKPALIDGATGRALTYGELARQVERVAAGLASRRFQKGDVFAIYCPNCIEYAIAFYAVARLGGINTTVNPLYTVEELAFQLNDSGAKYLLTTPHFIEKAREAVAQSGVKEIFALGEAEGATGRGAWPESRGRDMDSRAAGDARLSQPA